MPVKKPNKEVVAKKTRTPITDRTELSVVNPIPFEGGYSYSFQNHRKYLPFLHPDDNYGHLLLESRLLSDTHNACIVTKKDYCAGSGFQHIDNTDLDPNFGTWLKSMNLSNEPISEVNRQIFEGFFTFGNQPIELVRTTVGKEKRFFVYPHNFLEWRLVEPDEDDICQEAIQSKLFLRRNYVLRPEEYKLFKTLPIYNPLNSDKLNWKRVGNSERTLIWYKHSISGFSHYGLPSAVSSMIYQMLEYKSARYNLDNFENNMVVSAVLALKGNLSQVETDRIGKKVINTHTGDGKRGRVITVSSEEGITGSDFHSFDTHQEGSFENADAAWVQKIILANQWDAVLAGILSPHSFGKGAGFLTKILEIKQNTVIKPAQSDLMQKVWNNIIPELTSWMGFKIDINNINIRNAIDISGLTDVDITPAVKVNEVRKAKGLTEDTSPKGDMYLGELGANQKKGVYVADNSNPNV